MVTIFVHVKKTYRKTSRFQYGQRRTADTVQQKLFWQCSSYIAAFLFTWPLVMIGMLLIGAKGKIQYWFGLLLFMLAPFQGFVNALVYFRPRFGKFASLLCGRYDRNDRRATFTPNTPGEEKQPEDIDTQTPVHTAAIRTEDEEEAIAVADSKPPDAAAPDTLAAPPRPRRNRRLRRKSLDLIVDPAIQFARDSTRFDSAILSAGVSAGVSVSSDDSFDDNASEPFQTSSNHEIEPPTLIRQISMPAMKIFS
eukprot:CAMPEP_0116837934 /NCGR_PEP_ID=MMETSP0418-20121206/8932_1 /TAXON_ID=1158023 /ORGANISM="Astrosyne radiata, Strain 13vi08-1A" /LENGTH=251 /DNA_ID=CAMNT_0004467879 /DNA_START=155 /DNA_END=910 /DNA_ORIENTATION=-